jgi:hypothetical protein
MTKLEALTVVTDVHSRFWRAVSHSLELFGLGFPTTFFHSVGMMKEKYTVGRKGRKWWILTCGVVLFLWILSF